jgi:cytochrome c oxidase subunit 3
LSEAAHITPTGAAALSGHETFVTTPGHATGADTHGHGPSHVAHQFDDAAQQKEAVTLGMWAFLAQEIMFFGGAFLLYSVYRHSYSEAFTAASRLENWKVGCFNTMVLLVSSLTVVLSVRAAHHGDNRGVIKWIGAPIHSAVTGLGV